MPAVATSAGRLWYADHYRQRDYPPLVLVHGAGASHLDFPAELRRLNSLAPDLPGHGKSPGAGAADVRVYAAAIVALLDALQLPQAVILGHSMGGAIAQTLALDHATRVAGLVLLATGAQLPVNTAIIDGMRTDPAATAALLMKWEWAKSAPAALRERGLALLLQTDPAVTIGDYTACTRFDVRDRLAEITVPTLVIGGTADKMTPPDWSAALAQGMPRAQLELIEAGGHMVMVEQAAATAARLQRWLRAQGFAPADPTPPASA